MSESYRNQVKELEIKVLRLEGKLEDAQQQSAALETELEQARQLVGGRQSPSEAARALTLDKNLQTEIGMDYFTSASNSER